MRRPVSIPLVRNTTAFFVLTFTAMHEIDEKSPFFGEGAFEKLRAQGAEIYLSLSGTDETIGQTIHTRCRYSLDQIVKDARFADVLTVLEDGTRVIDYHRFHDVIPVEIARADVAQGEAMP
jgi:inward rectifier potassium channel